MDLLAPAAEVRDSFDALHRLIDQSHRRGYLEAEFVALLPEPCELSYGATASARMPVSIAYTDQSDRAAARR